MKTYAKIENGSLVYPPHEYVEAGYVYCPPTQEQVVAMGFKPVKDNRPVEDAQEGYWWRSSYSETEEAIIISYTLEMIEIHEPVSIG